MKRARWIFIWLAFTMDVKVRADVEILKLQGNADFSSQGKVVEYNLKSKSFAEPFEAEAFGKATVLFNNDHWQMGLGESGHVRINSPTQVDLFSGKLFISNESETEILVHAVQGIVKVSKGVSVITIQNNRTTAFVYEGMSTLIDRASQSEFKIDQGFQRWIGGLTSQGKRDVGLVDAVSYDSFTEDLRLLSTLNPEEIKAKGDDFLPVWQQAVAQVSKEREDQIQSDFYKLEKFTQAQAKKAEENKKEQAALRKLFRAKALGVPGLDTEAPSDSNRSPADSE